MMKVSRYASWGLLVAIGGAALMPVAAMASHQSNKNLGRNIGIGGAVVGLYGLTHHNTAAAVLGIAGAAAGAKMYEDNRKAESRNHSRYYHRHYYYRNGHRYYHSY